jgi:hypothetical protein
LISYVIRTLYVHGRMGRRRNGIDGRKIIHSTNSTLAGWRDPFKKIARSICRISDASALAVSGAFQSVMH